MATDSTSLNRLKTELQGSRGLIHKVRKEFIPSGSKLAALAWEKSSFQSQRLTEETVRRRFNELLCELIDLEYKLYLQYEEKCKSEGVIESVVQRSEKRRYPNVSRLVAQSLKIIRDDKLGDIDKLLALGSTLRPFYKLVEQSFAQGRMSRAGGSSQFHLEKLLTLAGYKGQFEMQQVLNGTVDFLFPGKYAWEKDRQKCVILSIKRTLRERYKQVFEELETTKGMTIYLLVTETYEEAESDITESKIDKLKEQNVYLVVRDEIREKRFPRKANVLGFTEFINAELPKRRALWKSLSNPRRRHR
jgi:hypothetical protein